MKNPSPNSDISNTATMTAAWWSPPLQSETALTRHLHRAVVVTHVDNNFPTETGVMFTLKRSLVYALKKKKEFYFV